MVTKKNVVVEGHEWGGFAGRYPAFDRATAWGVCKCGQRFDARTTAGKKKLHRAHALEVLAKRALVTDFKTVVDWARRDQCEAMQLAGPRERDEVAEHLATIEIVEQKVLRILEQEAR